MHSYTQGNGPQIIGIAGGSCAGKTWLAERLSQELGDKALRISLDDFYRDRSSLSVAQRARLNFDHPRAIDWAQLEKVLDGCQKRQPVSVPSYDFANHARGATEVALRPAPVVIVEGLWLFRRPAVRRLFSLKVFIRSNPDLCVSRRLERDTRERGRSRDQVLEQWRRYTLPSFERFVAPQERWADVILEAPVGPAEVSQLMNRIAENLYAFGL
jgi:uridine kinase